MRVWPQSLTLSACGAELDGIRSGAGLGAEPGHQQGARRPDQLRAQRRQLPCSCLAMMAPAVVPMTRRSGAQQQGLTAAQMAGIPASKAADSCRGRGAVEGVPIS